MHGPEYLSDEELLRRAIAREQELERTVQELERRASELKLRASELERERACLDDLQPLNCSLRHGRSNYSLRGGRRTRSMPATQQPPAPAPAQPHAR